MKKIICILAVSAFFAGCTSAKDTTASKEKEEKTETPAKSASPDRDVRGNYLK